MQYLWCGIVRKVYYLEHPAEDDQNNDPLNATPPPVNLMDRSWGRVPVQSPLSALVFGVLFFVLCQRSLSPITNGAISWNNGCHSGWVSDVLDYTSSKYSRVSRETSLNYGCEWNSISVKVTVWLIFSLLAITTRSNS